MLPIQHREVRPVARLTWWLRLGDQVGSGAFEGFVVSALYLGASAFVEYPLVRSN